MFSMIKNRFSARLPWIALSMLCLSAAPSFAQESPTKRFSGVNDIEFHQREYNNSFAGNGFLIEHKGKLYAVTVKHVLFEAKTPEMKNIWLADDLKQWRIHPLKNSTDYIQLGKLINADKNEEINGDILQRDWLVFEVAENHSSLTPLKIRQSSLQEGEKLRAIGCSYATRETCNQDIYKGHFKSYAEHNLRVDIGDTAIAQLRGLSGSPVVDEKDNLVGIVSNVLPAKGARGLDFAPLN
ncbi:serine protease [Alteromonadaceae bacterium M269]|nr:serine protease [Alteromonadaceae bacterium M269]